MSDRIYHIADARQWRAAQAQGRYEQSTRDRSLAQVGFIHCSWWEQVVPTAEFVYRGALDPLVVLTIDVDALEATGVRVCHEHGDPDDTSSPLFPHIYGPLPPACVCGVFPAHFDERGAFVVDDG